MVSRIVQSGRTIGTGNSGDMVSGSNPLPGTIGIKNK
nr:MAG TPA: hypothetical protein [Caudoviricetes sp.]